MSYHIYAKMSYPTTLVLMAGGIRQLWLLKTMLSKKPLQTYASSCDTILGTSAGALIGVLLAIHQGNAAFNRIPLAFKQPNISDNIVHLMFDMMCNIEVLPAETLKNSLRNAIEFVLGRGPLPQRILFHKNLVVGMVEHNENTSTYTEKLFEKNTLHNLDYVIETVAASASILGLTKSPSGSSDGAEVHSFPTERLQTQKGGTAMMICPYPKSELESPTCAISTGIFSQLKTLLQSFTYTGIMSHIGTDVDTCRKTCKANGVTFIEIYPNNYCAPKALFHLNDTQEKSLTACAEEMSTDIARTPCGKFDLMALPLRI